MNGPALARILQRSTHRLISSKYSEGRLSSDDSEAAGILPDMRDISNEATAWLPVEPAQLQDGKEAVFGVAHSRIINATFAFPHERGGRFNSSKRGAWYARFDLVTSQIEVAWHKTRALLDIGRLEESLAYDDYLADFGGAFHGIREDSNRDKYLDPHSYSESQAMAESLIEQGASGIIYPSVRHDGGN